MKLRIIKTALAVIFCTTVLANDGAYRSVGSVFYPINETTISLDEEVLSFTVVNKVANVNIYCEFYNPEQTERKIIVGFQAPYPTGDLNSRLLSSNNLISNFQVIKEGAILPYKIKAARCENCELNDTSAFEVGEGFPFIFVYLFEVTFKPGINIVNHSYDFPSSDNVITDQIYKYILTTGSKWAGGSIKNFTLQIKMDRNSYFYINDVFPEQAKWTILGAGKVTDSYTRNKGRMVRTISGMLEITMNDFKPIGNLEFGVPRPNYFTNILMNKDQILEFSLIAANFLTINFNNRTIWNFTKNDLQILRNAVYAFNGYQFKNPDLFKYFSQFEWYMPDPNLSSEKIKLTQKEQKFIDEIIALSK